MRLDGVQAWHDRLPARAELRGLLRQMGDLERWTNRAAQGIAKPTGVGWDPAGAWA
jgi:DNA mismatch repair ATPase MutS